MSILAHLKRHKTLIAMIHLPALPGTPTASRSPAQIVGQAVAEARLYRDAGVQVVLLENMHDTPYTRSVGPEITAVMAVAARAVKELGLLVGVQVLAGCNREAMAVALAAGLDFVRVEGFVFAHVADEGWIESSAGELLRYRRQIGADAVAVFADIKKKHSAHNVTADVDLQQTAEAAAFFRADGVIVTGSHTGAAASVDDLRSLQGAALPCLIGSGVTADNLPTYLPLAQGFIVGSWLKFDGRWDNPPDPARVSALLAALSEGRGPI